MRGIRAVESADPDSHIAPAPWKPTPATVIAVIGIYTRAPKAAAEMRDVMKAADPDKVAPGWESALEVAGTVEAAMEGVSASVSADMTAAVSSPVPSAAAVPTAMTPARGRDGRGESRRNKRACDGGSDGHCSKHGAVSS